METKQLTFNLRFSLSANIPDRLLEDDTFDEEAWSKEWKGEIKPGLIRAVFSYLRTFSHWDAHVRNRGIAPTDEIEIVITRRYDTPSQKPPLQ